MAGGEEINGPGGCLIGQVVIQGLVFRLVNYIAAAAAAAAATMVYFVLLLLHSVLNSHCFDLDLNDQKTRHNF